MCWRGLNGVSTEGSSTGNILCSKQDCGAPSATLLKDAVMDQLAELADVTSS